MYGPSSGSDGRGHVNVVCDISVLVERMDRRADQMVEAMLMWCVIFQC